MTTDKCEKKRILIVDDAPTLLNLLKKELQAADYEVLLAKNGREGISLAGSKKPDLILLDAKMPGLDGFETLEMIRTQNDSSGIPVFMITAHRTKEIEKIIEEKQIEGYFTKPFDMNALYGKIEKVVNRETEESWKKLNPVQREALACSLKAMERLRLWGEEGKEPFPKKQVDLAVEKIVTAIEEGEFKSIVANIRSHSWELFTHSVSVAIYLLLFAYNLNREKMRFTSKNIKDLAMAGFVHDVGKIKVPNSILRKKGPLTVGERYIVRESVDHTEKLLKSVPGMRSVIIEIATRHYERWDGKGYPKGLRGGGIGVPALMASIVNVFEALTGNRYYRSPLSCEEALDHMASSEGQFDQVLLARFYEAIIGEKPSREYSRRGGSRQ